MEMHAEAERGYREKGENQQDPKGLGRTNGTAAGPQKPGMGRQDFTSEFY